MNSSALFQFLLHLKQVANRVGAVLKNTTRLSAVNSLVCLSETATPIEMGAEAEFLCGRLAAVEEALSVASPGVTSFVCGRYVVNLL